jgi:SAM-dependent methyltransferase
MNAPMGKGNATAGLRAGSPDRFGYEWAAYSEMRPEYEEQFRRWTAPLTPDDWRGRAVLDVGCGMGRNSFWPLRYGAKRALALDVDERSVAAARQTLAAFPAAEVRQQSIYEFGERDAYDIAFSIGVIHHLQQPERALAAMTRAARPGGRVLIWVYGRENNGWIVYFFDPWRRLLFSRLPIGVVHHLSLYPSLLLWCVLRLGVGGDYLRLLRGFAFRHLRSVVFDQMLPRIAHYWRREEVERLMREAGLEDVRLTWVNRMSWSALGTKPAKRSAP